MKVIALRGVCIGVERHLKPGDTADLDPATVNFLVSIGAVAPVPDEPAPTQEQEPVHESKKPGKSGSKEK